METKFGLGQVSRKTPTWVKTLFMIVMILLGAVNEYINATGLVPDGQKAEILLVTTRIIGILALVAPMFGVKIKDSYKSGIKAFLLLLVPVFLFTSCKTTSFTPEPQGSNCAKITVRVEYAERLDTTIVRYLCNDDVKALDKILK